MSKKYTSVDEYLADVPASIRTKLQSLRKTIRRAAPQAEETISYNMPAYNLHGKVVYFAAFKAHIGFYPTASGIRVFQQELAAYETSKGAVRFAFDKPLPQALITKIVKYRVRENLQKADIRTQIYR